MPKTTSQRIPVTIGLPVSLFDQVEGGKKPEEYLNELFGEAYGASVAAVWAETVRDAQHEVRAKQRRNQS